MNTKFFVIPIVVVALFTAFAAPPVHAELVTITVILVAAFASAVIAKNVVTSNNDKEMASKPDDSDSDKQASTTYSKLAPVHQ